MDLSNLSRAQLLTMLQSRGDHVAESDPRDRITTPEDVKVALAKYAGKPQELGIVACLNGNHSIIDVRVISKGTVNRTVVHPREVFRHAIYKNAVSIVFAHNHPSGNLEPSSEDRQLTVRLKESGEILGISLLDSVIISEKGYYSFLENQEL